MKRYIGSVLILLVCGYAFAQVVTPPPTPAVAVSGISAVWAFLKPFILALMASNAMMTLVSAVLGKIPYLGSYLVAAFDVFMANPSHLPVTPPPPTP